MPQNAIQRKGPDITIIEELVATLPESPDNLQTRTRVQSLMRNLAALLQPFADVEATNRCFREDLKKSAETVLHAAERLQFEEGCVAHLAASIRALDGFNQRDLDVEYSNETFAMNVMTPDLLNEALEQSISDIVHSLSTCSSGDWQLREYIRRVDDLCSTLEDKVQDAEFTEATLERAKQLLQRINALTPNANALLTPERLASLQRLTENAPQRQERLERAFVDTREGREHIHDAIFRQ